MSIYMAITGDSVNKNCLQSASVDLLVCDPSFGIHEKKFDKNHYNRKESNVIDGYVEFPSDEEGYYKTTCKWLEQAKRVLKDDGSAYIVSGWSKSYIIHKVLIEQGWNIINKIIWKYAFGVNTSRKYVSSHYEIFYVSKSEKVRHTFNLCCRYNQDETDGEGRKLNYQDRESVWIINRDNQRGVKKNKNKLPYKLLEKMVLYSSNADDIVCDFFAGSFTLKDVCAKHNRHFIGQEINPEAVFRGVIKDMTEKEKELSRRMEQEYRDSL